VGLGLINAVISAVQEIRAKRKLDRLHLLGPGAGTGCRVCRVVVMVEVGADVVMTSLPGLMRRCTGFRRLTRPRRRCPWFLRNF
jgi:hypothetical protein